MYSVWGIYGFCMDGCMDAVLSEPVEGRKEGRKGLDMGRNTEKRGTGAFIHAHTRTKTKTKVLSHYSVHE